MNDLIDICVKNMVNDQFTEEQARSYMEEILPHGSLGVVKNIEF